MLLALHGITGTGALMRPLGERLADLGTVLAPDLRGRGGSAALPEPYGMDRHVEDLTAVLDAVGVQRAFVVGHSMGAAVAAYLGIADPDRVERLVLIDGGPVLPIPPGVDPDDAAERLLGPSLQRLSMTFPSRQAYHEFWRRHPAFADDWNAHVEWFLDTDLIGEPPRLRSCVAEASVRADGQDLLTNTVLRERFGQYTGPVLLLRAPHDLMNRPQPLLPDVVVDMMRSGWPQLREHTLSDVNHYTILLSDRGADGIAAAVRGELVDN